MDQVDFTSRVGNAAFRAMSGLASRARQPVRAWFDVCAAWNMQRVSPLSRYIVCDLSQADAVARWKTPSQLAHRLTVVVVTYRQPQPLLCLLMSLSCQTCRNFDIIVLHDGPDPATRDAVATFRAIDEAMPIQYVESAVRHNDWGHSLRQIGIDMASGDHVLITNGDNYYVPRLVEYAFDAIERHELDVALWDMVHSHPNAGGMKLHAYSPFVTYPLRRRLDIGAFMVNASLAKAAGFKDRSHDADASYFEDVLRARPGAPLNVGKIHRTLMTHN